MNERIVLRGTGTVSRPDSRDPQRVVEELASDITVYSSGLILYCVASDRNWKATQVSQAEVVVEDVEYVEPLMYDETPEDGCDKCHGNPALLPACRCPKCGARA